MADVTVKRVEEMESIWGGSFVRARASLGASSFGMNIWNFPPNWDQVLGAQPRRAPSRGQRGGGLHGPQRQGDAAGGRSGARSRTRRVRPSRRRREAQDHDG